MRKRLLIFSREGKEETRDHDAMPVRHEKENHKTKNRKDGKP